jgi:hypothetical protein
LREKSPVGSYPGKANLVTEAVESSDAQFRVTNIVKLGETKSIPSQYQKERGDGAL